MLTKEDLQLLQEMMTTVVQESEERMTANFDDKLEQKAGKFDDKLAESQNQIKAYIENGVAKDIKILAEGHQIMNEKLDRILDRVETAENLEPRVSALEVKVKENSADISQLKQA